MKRTLVALLLAAMPLLAACSSGDQPDTTGDSVSENTQTEAPGGTPSPATS